MANTTITLNQLQAVAPLVLEELRSMATLPPAGTVAGQAVASLFWKALGLQMKGPVNDIDVFVNLHMPLELRGGPPESSLGKGNHIERQQKTTTHWDVAVDRKDYGMVSKIALRCNTEILSTYRRGLVNYTLIQSPSIPAGKITQSDHISKSLVDGFDLNLVSVGINLESGNVVASEGFLQFLEDQQIRVQTCNTPAHTLIRLANKVHGGQIQQVKCDYDQERALLEAAIVCQGIARDVYNNRRSFLLRFGAQMKSKYDNVTDHLPDLSEETITSYNNEKVTLYNMIARPQPSVALERMKELAEQTPPTIAAKFGLMGFFPALWRTMMSEPENGPTQAGIQKVAHTTNNTKAMYTLLVDVLKKPVDNIDVPGMDETERALFFFQQQAANDPKTARQAAEAWEALDPIEQYLYFSANIFADDLLALAKDPGHMQRLMVEHGRNLLHQTGQIKVDRDEDVEVLDDLLYLWVENIQKLGTPYHHILEEHFHSVTSPSIVAGIHLPAFLNSTTCNTQKGEAVLQKIMEIVFPGWPEPAVENEQAHDNQPRQQTLNQIATIFRYSALLGVSPDSAWINTLSHQDALTAITSVTAISNNGHGYDQRSEAGARKLIEALLPKLETADILANRYQIGLSVVECRAGDLLAAWLFQQGETGHTAIHTMLNIFEEIRNTTLNHTRQPEDTDIVFSDEKALFAAESAFRRHAMLRLGEETLKTRQAPEKKMKF